VKSDLRISITLFFRLDYLAMPMTGGTAKLRVVESCNAPGFGGVQ
jgi:hypothetical protein